jgi:hypothetical protein
MKAVELINRALVLAGIVARDLQQASGSEPKDGLFWLNQILARKSANGRLIPYYGHAEITSTQGEEFLFFENMVTADVLTFNIGDIRYSVKPVQRDEFFGSSRPENISSLPYQWYWERVPGGINVYLYFTPAQDYPVKVTGIKSFDSVTYDTQLDDAMDKFYQNYLMYDLAEALASWKKLSLPPLTAQILKEIRNEVRDINPKDYSIYKISMFGSDGVLSYAQINLGRGWTAP